jgi:hypothetical protein
MQRYTVYLIWKLLYMFRVYHHPSSEGQTTVSTASGICHTVTATCRYRGSWNRFECAVSGIRQFILSGNCTTCFGWYHYPSSGGQTTVSTASGICHTVTATCRYRGRVATGLSVLWVAYASLFFLETALHVSGGISTHHQERIQLYLQHLVLLTPLLLSAAIVEELELVWVCCGWRAKYQML